METPLTNFKPSEKRRREEDEMESPLETINIREFMRSHDGKVGEKHPWPAEEMKELLTLSCMAQGLGSQEEAIRARNEVEMEMRNKEQNLAAERSMSLSMARAVAQKEVAEVEKLLDAELSMVSQLESEKAALTKSLQMVEEEVRAARLASRMAEVEHKKQLDECKFLAIEAQQQLRVAQAECDKKCLDAALKARLERKRREGDQAVLAATQAQLEDKIREGEERERKLQQAQLEVLALKAQSTLLPHSSNGSTTGLLAERVRQLEEALNQQKLSALVSSEAMHTTRVSTGGGGPNPHPKSDASELLRSSSAALDQVQSKLQGWQQVLSSALDSAASEVPSVSSSTPEDLTPEKAALAIQKVLEHANELRELVQERDTRLLELSTIHREAEGRAEGLESRRWEYAAALQSASIAETTAKCRLVAVERERDGLRRALAPSPAPSKSKGHSPGTISEHLQLVQQAARADELQELVSELQSRLTLAQEEVAAAKSSEAKQRVESEAAEAKAKVAEVKAAQLEKEANSLALDVSSLQEKLGRGEVNRSSIRVLHLKMNPEAQLQREEVDRALSEARTENEALRSRLKQLAQEVEESRRQGLSFPAPGESLGAVTAGNPESSSSGVHALAVKDAQVAVLQHRLGELEKTMVRLKEVTKERVAAFREACYCLFGFRVDMTSEATSVKDAASAPTTFSLRPQHIDDPSTVLVFRYTKSRGMELVPNSHSSKMGREVEIFIRKFNSIPAFTANLTMESFQKQTAC